jgi:hypothetical protein
MNERCHDVWGVPTGSREKGARAAADRDAERGAMEGREGSGREARERRDVVAERMDCGREDRAESDDVTERQGSGRT